MALTATRKKPDFSGTLNSALNNDTVMSAAEPEQSEAPVAADVKKNRVGRPSKGEVRKYSIAIDTALVEHIEMCADLFYHGNKTEYINALIRKDKAEHMEEYKQIKDLISKEAKHGEVKSNRNS